jgi:hypothetical protein
MTLIDTVKALNAAKLVAQSEPGDTALNRVGRETAINGAKADIVRLTKEVKKLTNEVSGGIFVDGPGTSAFAAIAEDEGHAVTVDAGKLYETLADAVETTLSQNSSREWRLDIVRSLMAQLSGLSERLGISYMAGLDTTKYNRTLLATRDDTLAMVRDVVRKAVGDDLNGLLLQTEVADAVIKSEYAQAVVPVIVINAHPDDVTGLGNYAFNKRFITTTTKEEVAKSDVITAFKHLKPLLKRNS